MKVRHIPASKGERRKYIPENEIYEIAIVDRPSYKTMNSVTPNDQLQPDSRFPIGDQIDWVRILEIVELNPGCQLVVKTGSNRASGFWVPVELEEDEK